MLQKGAPPVSEPLANVLQEYQTPANRKNILKSRSINLSAHPVLPCQTQQGDTHAIFFSSRETPCEERKIHHQWLPGRRRRLPERFLEAGTPSHQPGFMTRALVRSQGYCVRHVKNRTIMTQQWRFFSLTHFVHVK